MGIVLERIEPSPTVHIPVLLQEVVEHLQISPGSTIVDGTLGGAGHAIAILDRLGSNGVLIGIDRDPAAIARASLRLESALEAWRALNPQSQAPRVLLSQSSYLELPEVLSQNGISGIDGLLLDLGLSSDQLADRERGFSFRDDGPLDLRFDPSSGVPAFELLSRVREEELANMIFEYGEERFSRRIARNIVEARRVSPIRTTKQLYDLVHRSVPGKVHGRIDSATRTFQALRIAVNRELEHLESALKVLPPLLNPGGRFLAISFHSLEDRLVKNAFRETEGLQNLTKKPIVASATEVAMNPRSRSAKLRVSQRISD